jgi:CHASE1-domain containing sensor protein
MHTLVVAPVDPLTFWIPACAVVIAAFINVATVIVATRLAGSNSDRSLARTIEADRRGRVLERQLDLYGEILNFVSKRKQKRDEVNRPGFRAVFFL